MWYLWFPIQTQSITTYGLDYTQYWCSVVMAAVLASLLDLPCVPSDSRIPYFYRNSIKKIFVAPAGCSPSCSSDSVAARVSLTWKWYEIVYEKNFVWGNCLLNQRGPHYPAPLCPLAGSQLGPAAGPLSSLQWHQTWSHHLQTPGPSMALKVMMTGVRKYFLTSSGIIPGLWLAAGVTDAGLLYRYCLINNYRCEIIIVGSPHTDQIIPGKVLSVLIITPAWSHIGGASQRGDAEWIFPPGVFFVCNHFVTASHSMWLTLRAFFRPPDDAREKLARDVCKMLAKIPGSLHSSAGDGKMQQWVLACLQDCSRDCRM